MKITPPADDTGTESLKRINVKKTVQEVDHVEPYPAIAPTERRGAKRRPVEFEQRHEERRHDKRRKEEEREIYDTRDHHERRTQLRREENGVTQQGEEESSNAGKATPDHGIDVEA